MVWFFYIAAQRLGDWDITMQDEDIYLLLKHHLQQASLNISEDKIHLLAQYIELLYQWNPVYNLTAVESREAFIVEHVLDSLAAGAYLEGDDIIDVGTGGGLPGIPLAIYYPDKHFTLLDSRGKKHASCKRSSQSLNLKM